jgi:23S rRNA pseudouridine2605 synthase
VTRLIRVAFGPFSLGKLPRGGIEEIPQRVLRESLENFFSEKKGREVGEKSFEVSDCGNSRDRQL